MSMEKPPSARSEDKLKIVKPVSERLGDTTRRSFLKYGGAVIGSAALGSIGAETTTNYLLDSESNYEAEKAFIEAKLKEYEEAREQGVKEWFQEWKGNFKEGLDKHGVDIFGAMGEFSEEGLRFRLLSLKTLSGLYTVANGVFFVAYTTLLFAPIKNGIEKLQENKTALAKDKKLEDFVNRLEERVVCIEEKFESLKQRQDFTEVEFREVADEIEDLLLEVADSPLANTETENMSELHDDSPNLENKL